ncbi:wnt inhibitory factor 1-like isoform X2 [Pristis pectinata]|uniref:wnt inhibitory factor 1-like isoform X2 n=1 Tax=Pristis pectinata TaxID=685728 RepID=UPI00223CB1ED|nr:wnt inhibitory factor 1-like isoform X2 [Pristis pectinata]
MCSPPCAHGGTCLRSNTCLCPPGWAGRGCHTAVCAEPCANGGKCVAPNTCQCPSDYTGEQCLTEPVACDPRCGNGGVCVGYNKCRCQPQFTGPICETVVQTPCVPPCQHGGTCRQLNRCECAEGTAGSRCQRLTCPLVTLTVSTARATRRGVAESYVDRCGPLGVKLCIKYRINQVRVYVQAYKVGYKIMCPKRLGVE